MTSFVTEALTREHDRTAFHCGVEALDRYLRELALLLCYERDPAHCHRNRLAAELHARLGLPVEHLFCAPI